MSNLEQQIKQAIEKHHDNLQECITLVPFITGNKVKDQELAFSNGFNKCKTLLLPLLLKAIEQRDEADMLLAQRIVPDKNFKLEIDLAKKNQNKELLKLLGEL